MGYSLTCPISFVLRVPSIVGVGNHKLNMHGIYMAYTMQLGLWQGYKNHSLFRLDRKSSRFVLPSLFHTLLCMRVGNIFLNSISRNTHAKINPNARLETIMERQVKIWLIGFIPVKSFILINQQREK